MLEPLFQVEVARIGERLVDFIRPFVKRALTLGADEVEVFAEQARSHTVNLENSALKSVVGSVLQGVGIRILKDKSLGFVSVNSFDTKRVEKGLLDALSIAKSTPSADYYLLPEPKPINSMPTLCDKEIDTLSTEDILNIGNRIIDTAKGFDERVTIGSMSFLTAKSTDRAIASSRGIEAEYKKTLLQWLLFGMAVDDDNVGSFNYMYYSVTNLSDADIEGTTDLFSERVLQNLGAKKGKRFSGPAILTPEAMSDLLVVLQRSASANQIQSGSSFLADRLGEQVAVDDITVVDDGTLPTRAGSSPFDREGVPHQRHSIVESGVFKGALFDAFSANRENLDSTGHASGSYRQAPHIGVTNIDVSAGDASLEEMIADVKKGILIPRVSAFPDPVSGVFAGPIKGGQLIENGAITNTLKEIQVTGRFFDMLKNVSMMSKERRIMSTSSFMGPQESTIRLPYFKVEGLEFSV